MSNLVTSLLIFCRMVLYFPVSALVTLFGNILQNPLDPRARSDTKLMNVVVTFLSMLGHEAETGGVHRMLGVCSEFERIAKVVIEKTEKEQASRRKRKNQDQSSNKPSTAATADGQSPSFNPSPVPPTSRPTTSSSATPQASHSATAAVTNNRHLSPPANDHRSPPKTYSPMTGTGTMSQSPSPGLAPSTAGWPGADFSTTPDHPGDYGTFADLAGFDATMSGMHAHGVVSPPPPLHGTPGPGPGGVGGGGGFFQQPMLPQDLFSLPMTLDWDWAEMSGGAYPSVENGNYGNLGEQHGGLAHGQRFDGGGSGEGEGVNGQGR